jgi:hypothetical protein
MRVLPRGQGEAVAMAQMMRLILMTVFCAQKLKIAAQRDRCHFFLASEMFEAHACQGA